ncbi:LacI family DNA-binding transcriptional regulator [Dictyobacter aurantiacus]|uniref:LacI family transcriptional regulator n=1 Tax=Dictyobacter aurantiacus TaxID=1936993 RepID=A0A401ZM32_9CHLR|nr:LacI family DNA-binding transcriptional regulator [Dictyobacter aurantiacus]GCE07913.1 LacI family transcriptional regulator [Dictyobacter aurantiacus]
MSAERSVTIKDVAAHAAVSVATVSAVMNENKYVSPELAQRVRASIAALGYKRNNFARGLKTQVSHSIGLVIPDIMNPFYTNIARGVEDVTHTHNYSLIIGNTDEDPEKEKKYLHLLDSKQADGLIIAVTDHSFEYLQELPLQNLALVGIDRSLIELGIDTVLVNNTVGTRTAIEHLIGLGHRRIGLVTGARGITPTEERLVGYTEALEKHGIAVDPALIATARARVDGGERGAHQLLTLEDRPTALFLMDGTMVIGAMRAIAQLGLRCPEEIALICFDDFAWAPVMRPHLTVVDQPTYEIGKQAAHLLFERLQHQERAPREVRLQTRFIVRESCGSHLRSPDALSRFHA